MQSMVNTIEHFCNCSID